VAVEKELHKRISRHYSRLRRRAHAARIYKVKTGLCPGKAPKDPRSWLLYGFHPFRERQRLERTGRAINQRLHDGTFQPLPVLERVIRKTGGGTRSVTVLSVRDAAASRWLYDRLMKRYGWMLSSYAFAYRRDRNHREAVLYLYRTLQKHKRIWTVECDFASFFDSIDHAYLRHVRDLLVELDVVRGNHHAHAPDSKNALDPVLPGENVAFAYSSRRVRTALHHALAPPIQNAATRNVEARPNSPAFDAYGRGSSRVPFPDRAPFLPTGRTFLTGLWAKK
jgi:hypothetical protein